MNLTDLKKINEDWNPTVGCRRISQGCDNCPSVFEAHRKNGSVSHYTEVTKAAGNGIDWTGQVNVAPDHIFYKPLRTNTPKLFGVNSDSDLFGEGVPDAVIKRVFAMMQRVPHHTFQIKTKRPFRAVQMASQLPWPPNVWIGVSIESDKHTGRADLLRHIPAEVRFIVAEPLLGPLPSLNLEAIHWVLVGGEVGEDRKHIRSMKPDWANEIRYHCARTGIPFYFKGWGNWDQDGDWHPSAREAGRLLEGRTWDAMPELNHRRLKLTSESETLTRVLLPADLKRDKDGSYFELRRLSWEAFRQFGPMTSEEVPLRAPSTPHSKKERRKLSKRYREALIDLQQLGLIKKIRRPTYDRGKPFQIEYIATKSPQELELFDD